MLVLRISSFQKRNHRPDLIGEFVDMSRQYATRMHILDAPPPLNAIYAFRRA